MNKPKAPRDMSVEAFIDLVEKRYHAEEPTNMNAWINTLRMIAEEPAQNPFTPDQLATMRELQRNGFGYAAKDPCDTVFAYENEPEQDEDGYWTAEKTGGNCIKLPFEFLAEALDSEDKKSFCFADYAPLDSPCEGGEKG